MIVALLAAAAVLTADPAFALEPDLVVARYARALAGYRSPRLLTFEYTIEQSGAKSSEQSHRVFRRGNDERDEILSVDGKRLAPPAVRIFRGRRNRYTIEGLAPRVSRYDFHYLGPHKDGRHQDYVFATTPKGAAGAFRVTRVTIDGATFLPDAIGFATTAHAGRGTIVFVRVAKYTVALAADAHATYANLASSERLRFARYRFPAVLPSSTFALPRPLPSPTPKAAAVP